MSSDHKGPPGAQTPKSLEEPHGQIRLSAEALRRRRRRSIGIGVLLGVIVAVFYVLAFVKMGQQLENRPASLNSRGLPSTAQVRTVSGLP